MRPGFALDDEADGRLANAELLGDGSQRVAANDFDCTSGSGGGGRLDAYMALSGLVLDQKAYATIISAIAFLSPRNLVPGRNVLTTFYIH